ncbi:type I polyketide synthase, partial [Streptomyces sp. PA03-6a]|nr:type I polyketide synthase [Streptomyces sp. PA03-6a]
VLLVQVVVGPVESGGLRPVEVFARPDVPGSEWVSHAAGLIYADSVGVAAELGGGVWPPAGAQPLELDGFYEQLASRGYEYGALFRAVRAVWRDGDEVFAELVLDSSLETTGFVIHPVLLDAALHTVGLSDAETADDGSVHLPFAWQGASVHAASAGQVRVRISPTATGDGVRLVMTDAAGLPVLTLESLKTRPVPLAELETLSAAAGHTTAGPRSYTLQWEKTVLRSAAGLSRDRVAEIDGVTGLVPLLNEPDDLPSWVVLQVPGATADAPVVDGGRVRQAITLVLEAVQAFLTDPLWEGSRLVVATTGAVTVTETERGALDPAAAAVWGLIRSAQNEHPERILLLDHDTASDIHAGLCTSLAERDEWQAAIRAAQVLLPRLAPAASPSPSSGEVITAGWDPQGTVLITGGTGVLGALIAEHLAATGRTQNLLLVSRQGPAAPGAFELADRLRNHGAQVEIAACDLTDRQQAAALITAVPQNAPLTAIVHTAGVLDDAVITALDPERLKTVLAPKVDALVHLDDLTRETSLAGFITFTSIAGVTGSPGQANYAAANAAADAITQRRHHAGLPATALAWGLWAPTSGMTAQLTPTDHARISRSGILPLSADDGIRLFDQALNTTNPHLIPAAIDRTALRSQATYKHPSPLLRNLVGTPRRSHATTPTPAATTLVNQLAELDPQQRRTQLTNFICHHVAAVLDINDSTSLTPTRAFREIGFDSLTAVELRNRLSTTTGIKLPATVVFDYPTPHDLSLF